MFNADDLIRRLEAEARRRLAKAASFFAAEVKVVLSVPAPRKVSRKTGRPYATTRATPGAPPRKLTGRGRADVAWVLTDNGRAAVVGTSLLYMRRHERQDHPWLRVTFDRLRPRIVQILRGN